MRSKPFDLTLLDYNTQRRLKRRKLLVWSLPAVIPAFLMVLWLSLPQLLTSRAINDYKHGQPAAARSWLTPLTWTSPEQFVIAFNSGTTDAAQSKFERSEKELTRALVIAPRAKRCMAAQNLVLALTAHAKSLSAGSQSTALNKQAKAVIKDNPSCFKGGSSGGGGSSNSSSDSQSPSESQQQQLEQKEQEGRERQAQYAREETYNPDNPNIKPW